MLSSEITELLSAFVDGELNQRQREAVMRLLNKSSEARELLRQLQENAHRIKQLPRHKVEPSLVEAVMQAIAEQKPKPMAAPRPARRRWLPYVAAGLAASLLIGVVSIFAWQAFHEQENHKGNGMPLVKGEEKKPEPTPTPMPEPTPRKPNPLLAQMVEGTFDGFAKLPPPERAFSAPFADLRSEKGVKLADLAREIDRTPAVRLDVTVKNNASAIDRLKDALKDRGINLVIDPSAKKSLNAKGQAKAEYLVYAENLNADELTKLLSELGESYVVPGTNNQKTVESPYKKVTLAPIAQDDKLKVAKLLGVDAAAMEPKAGAKADAKRLAVVLPTSAGSQPSAEVRQLLSQRRPPQPGSVQVLIKIHQE